MVSNEGGRLYVVATPIGNLGDITLRAIEVLREVDLVAAEDTRHSGRLLDHLGIQRPLFALHEHNETAAGERLLGRLRQGARIALVSDAGTPLISDPGFPLVRACRAAGIPVIAVPGPSALVAALSVSGLPTDRFRFEGFPPRRQAARVAAFEGLRVETATLVFYEASHRILETLQDMAAVFGAGREAVLARELTKRHETVRQDTLGALADWVAEDPDQRRGEFVLLLAGAPAGTGPEAAQLDALLVPLLEELPLRQAVRLAERISGLRRNLVYQRALELAPEQIDPT